MQKIDLGIVERVLADKIGPRMTKFTRELQQNKVFTTVVKLYAPLSMMDPDYTMSGGGYAALYIPLNMKGSGLSGGGQLCLSTPCTPGHRYNRSYLFVCFFVCFFAPYSVL